MNINTIGQGITEFFKITSELEVRTVFFAMSSIIVSITIFSAGFLSSSKLPIEKKMLSKKIPVIELLKSVMITFILFFFKQIYYDFVYLSSIFSFFIIFFEVRSIGLALLVIIFTGRLTTDTKYYDDQMNYHIVESTKRIEEEYKRELKEEPNENYYKKYNIKFIDDNFFDYSHKYKEIIVKSNGLVTAIKKDIDKYKKDYEIILKKCIGLYCKKGDILGYFKCKKSVESIIAEDIFEFNNNYIPKVDRYSEIFDYLFMIEKFSTKVDDDNRISEYYNLLCVNNYQEAENLFCDRINDIYINEKDKFLSIEKYIYFVDKIKNISYNNNNLSSFKYIQGIITQYFYDLIDGNKEITGRIKFLYMFRLIKLKKNIVYYDFVLANLLNIFYHLLKKRKYEDITILIKEYHYILNFNEGSKEIKIANLSFIIGLYNGLYHQYFHESIDTKNLEKIISTVRNYYYIYDGSEIIDNYINILKIESYTKSASTFCFDKLEDYKSGVIYSNNNIDEIKLLLIFLDNMNTVIYKNNILEYKAKDKDELVYYEKMKNIISEGEIYINNNKYKLKNINNNNTSEFGDYLSIMIKKYKDLENDYLENTKIRPLMIKKFIKLMCKNKMPSTRLLVFLKDNNLFQHKKSSNKIEYSYEYKVSRELFFENNFNINQLAESFVSDYYDKISKLYCDYLKNHFVINSNNSLKGKNYINFISVELYNSILYSKDKQGKLENCVPSNYIDGCISVPFNELPILYFDIDYSKNTFIENKNIFIFDLSYDEDKRKELINRNYSLEDLKKSIWITLKIIFDVH